MLRPEVAAFKVCVLDALSAAATPWVTEITSEYRPNQGAHRANAAFDVVLRSHPGSSAPLPIYRLSRPLGAALAILKRDPRVHALVAAGHGLLVVTEPDATQGTGFGHYHCSVDEHRYVRHPSLGVLATPGLWTGALLIDRGRGTQYVALELVALEDEFKKATDTVMYDSHDQNGSGGMEQGGAWDDEGGMEAGGAFDETGGCNCTGEFGGADDAELARRYAAALAEEAARGGPSDEDFEVGGADDDEGGPRQVVRGKANAINAARSQLRAGRRRVRVTRKGSSARERGSTWATEDAMAPFFVWNKDANLDVRVLEGPKLSAKFALQSVFQQLRDDSTRVVPAPTLLRDSFTSTGAVATRTLAVGTTGATVRSLPFVAMKFSGNVLSTTPMMTLTVALAYTNRAGAATTCSMTMEIAGKFQGQLLVIHPFVFSQDVCLYAPGILTDGTPFEAGATPSPATCSVTYTGVDSGVKIETQVPGVRDDATRDLFKAYNQLHRTWRRH